MSGNTLLPRLSGALYRPFIVGEGRVPVAAVVRIALGLVLLHQAVDALGFVSILENADEAGWLLLRAAALALGLTLGVMTPWMGLGLILHITFGAHLKSLGDQVAVVALWGMVLLGAGHAWSVDAVLRRRWPRLAAALGLGLGAVSTEARAAVRFALVTLFWGICAGAMIYHARDPHWQRGEALTLSLTASYWSDYSAVFRALAQASPRLFAATCTAALLVQSIWELLLLPLAYLRWGRRFVILQGFAFFGCSIVILNLQYLPVIEVCLWTLLFTPESNPEANPESAPASERGWRWLGPASLGVVALNLALIGVAAMQSSHPAILWPITYKNLYLFAQCGTSVFNSADQAAAHAHFILYEVDGHGRPIRVVPFLDLEGRRLGYLRNDVLMYRRSIGWQHAPAEAQYQSTPEFRPSPMTEKFARELALLDARLTGSGPRKYRAELFDRDKPGERSRAVWGPGLHKGGWAIEVSAAESGAPTSWPLFDLPPGHWFESRRIRHTQKALDEHYYLVKDSARSEAAR